MYDAIPERKLWTLLAKACTTLKTTSGRLSLDLSRIPTQHPDPPVEATLEELKAAWSKTCSENTQERRWSDDHCAEINGKVRQLLRLNDRVRNMVLCEEEARELPSEMDFDKGYDPSPRNNVGTSSRS